LIKDAWRAQDWKDKCRIWLMPTGWRPADVAQKYPVFKIEDVYQFENTILRIARYLVFGFGFNWLCSWRLSPIYLAILHKLEVRASLYMVRLFSYLSIVIQNKWINLPMHGFGTCSRPFLD